MQAACLSSSVWQAEPHTFRGRRGHPPPGGGRGDARPSARKAPKVHRPLPPSPALTGDAEPPLVSTSAMDETDHARGASPNLASKKVVFEHPKEATREGCRLSAPVSLTRVPTLLGERQPCRPSRPCCGSRSVSSSPTGFGIVAAPLTLAYTGQKLAEIETGPGFACTARLRQAGERWRANNRRQRRRNRRHLLRPRRQTSRDGQGARSPHRRFADDGLRLFHYGLWARVLIHSGMKRICISGTC